MITPEEFIKNLKDGKYDGYRIESEENGVSWGEYIDGGQLVHFRRGKTPKPFFDGKETERLSGTYEKRIIDGTEELTSYLKKVGYKFYDFPEVVEYSKNYYENLENAKPFYISATKIGRQFGWSAQEINYLLKELGILDGEPGAYYPTELGDNYTKYDDRGYLKINPNIFDDLDVDVNDEKKAEIAEAISIARNRFKAGDTSKEIVEELTEANESTDLADSEKNINAIVIVVILILSLAAAYGFYKFIYPHVKKWWINNVRPNYSRPCPNCSSEIKRNFKNNWQCKECGFSISDDYLKNGYVFWFCDECGAFLNTQKDFDSFKDDWTCTKCGAVTPLIMENDDSVD